MEIQYNQEEPLFNSQGGIQPISNVINMKPKKIMTNEDIQEDEKRWMGDDIRIKRLLGLTGPENKKNVLPKVEKNQDYVEFDNSSIE